MNFSDPLGLDACGICKWFEGVWKSYLAASSKLAAKEDADLAQMDKGLGLKPGTTRMLIGLAAGATGGIEEVGAGEGAAAAGAPEGPTYPGNDAAKAPPGTEWRGGPGSAPGDANGNYYNPTTGESFHPDLNHPGSIGPHWDYRGPNGKWYRLMPNGTVIPKS